MAQVYLPSPLRRLTQGQARVAAGGQTVTADRCGIVTDGAEADTENVSWLAATTTKAKAKWALGRERIPERSRPSRSTDTPVRRAPTNRWRKKMGGNYWRPASAPTACGLNTFKPCELARKRSETQPFGLDEPQLRAD